MATIKLALQPRATFKGKIGSNFPSIVTGIPPVTITPIAGGFQFSIDIDELDRQLRQEEVINLVDVAMPTNVALDASLGNTFYLGAGGNRTIGVPTNKPAAPYSQKITIMHEALGGVSRTLLLNTVGAGSFRHGTFVSSLSATTAGAIDYIGAIYNPFDDRWDIVSYSKGF